MMWESFGEQETAALGRELAAQVKPGDILLLEGDLGVGKTVFAKGFAEGLGITEPITSPTFTLIQEYEEGRLPLYHFDVYRIADEEEMYEIGYESYFFGQGVCLIEWASRIPGLLPDDCRTVQIQKDLKRGLDYRRIELVDGIALLQGDE